MFNAGNARRPSAKAKLLQVGGDRGVEPCTLGLLFAQLGCEALHLLSEGLAVVLQHLGADIAADGEHMAVLADL